MTTPTTTPSTAPSTTRTTTRTTTLRSGLLPALAKPPSLEARCADGLLAALTLAPATWSRNRFFDLYKDPTVQRVRRRAGLLRGVVRHLARTGVEGLSETQDGEGCVLAYRIRDLGLSRTVVLSAFENAVLRVTLARAKGEPPLDPWKAIVDRALAQLEQRSALGSVSTRGRPPPRSERVADALAAHAPLARFRALWR